MIKKQASPHISDPKFKENLSNLIGFLLLKQPPTALEIALSDQLGKKPNSIRVSSVRMALEILVGQPLTREQTQKLRQVVVETYRQRKSPRAWEINPPEKE